MQKNVLFLKVQHLHQDNVDNVAKQLNQDNTNTKNSALLHSITVPKNSIFYWRFQKLYVNANLVCLNI